MALQQLQQKSTKFRALKRLSSAMSCMLASLHDNPRTKRTSENTAQLKC